jgi:hypothetical protein
MPTINIHAHCADGEYVLALLEQVQLNTLHHDFSVITDESDANVPYRLGAGPDEPTWDRLDDVQEKGPDFSDDTNPHGIERPHWAACTAGDDCLDPFCDIHHPEQGHSAGDTAEDIQMISMTIFHAFVGLCNDHGFNAWSCEQQAMSFVADNYGEPSDGTPFLDLPRDSKVWWLIVLWAIQDWKARGIKVDVARSMVRGIAADVRGAVKV